MALSPEAFNPPPPPAPPSRFTDTDAEEELRMMAHEAVEMPARMRSLAAESEPTTTVTPP